MSSHSRKLFLQCPMNISFDDDIGGVGGVGTVLRFQLQKILQEHQSKMLVLCLSGTFPLSIINLHWCGIPT